MVLNHVLVGTLRNGEDVGRALVTPLVGVDFHGPDRVDWVTDIGVNGDAEEAGVGLNKFGKNTN